MKQKLRWITICVSFLICNIMSQIIVIDFDILQDIGWTPPILVIDDRNASSVSEYAPSLSGVTVQASHQRDGGVASSIRATTGTGDSSIRSGGIVSAATRDSTAIREAREGTRSGASRTGTSTDGTIGGVRGGATRTESGGTRGGGGFDIDRDSGGGTSGGGVFDDRRDDDGGGSRGGGSR